MYRTFFVVFISFYTIRLRSPLFSALFPYTTLFRSYCGAQIFDEVRLEADRVEDLRGRPQGVLRRQEFRRHPHQDRGRDRQSTRLNSSHVSISYAVFCLKKKNETEITLHDVNTYSKR